MLTIDRIESGLVTVLRLTGEIDEAGQEVLRKTFNACQQDGRVNIVLNVSAVTYISYMGLGVLVERLRQVRRNNGDIKLAGLNLYGERLLRMTGAKNVFERFESESRAVQQYLQAA